jgi:hypothetical protein
MSEPWDEPVDLQIRDGLRSLHARFQPSSFDADWDAAQARLTELRGDANVTAVRSRGARHFWAAAAASVLLAVGVITGAVLIPAPGPDAPRVQQPDSIVNTNPGQQANPGQQVWYTPSDELLHVSSLRYAAQPARRTVYDPLTLEVDP